MKPDIHKGKSFAIAFDASLMGVPNADYFSVDYWTSRQAVNGQALGRGSAWFIDAPFGPVVLRKYFRGGWAARISRDRYFFSSVSRSRPFREYHLLAALHEQGLPVPRPIAALCEHRWFISTGAIMTARISAARTLADLLPGNNDGADTDSGLWASVGRCIRRFHEAGVWHADLNARNILLDADLDVYLIDFDRARFTPGKAVNGQANLKRLKRSLVKLWPVADERGLHAAWKQFKAAYDG